MSDFEELSKATRELEKLSIQLAAMVPSVADARTVLEYDSERRKAALSRAVLTAFKAGATSTSHAEHEARASAKYEDDMRGLATDYTKAERTKTEFEVIRIKVDSLRTLVSAAKLTYNL
jgi:hypothetical protein